eukprot:565466-Rhodomonas_salina.2
MPLSTSARTSMGANCSRTDQGISRPVSGSTPLVHAVSACRTHSRASPLPVHPDEPFAVIPRSGSSTWVQTSSTLESKPATDRDDVLAGADGLHDLAAAVVGVEVRVGEEDDHHRAALDPVDHLFQKVFPGAQTAYANKLGQRAKECRRSPRTGTRAPVATVDTGDVEPADKVGEHFEALVKLLDQLLRPVLVAPRVRDEHLPTGKKKHKEKREREQYLKKP